MNTRPRRLDAPHPPPAPHAAAFHGEGAGGLPHRPAANRPTESRTAPAGMSLSDRSLSRILRVAASFNFLAVVPAFMPTGWIDAIHKSLLGPPFPTDPVAEYLARSASLLYVFHGGLLFYAAGDVAKFHGFLKLYASLVTLAGPAFLAVDLLAGMPAWWAWGEGGSLFSGGLLVLGLLKLRGDP